MAMCLAAAIASLESATSSSLCGESGPGVSYLTPIPATPQLHLNCLSCFGPVSKETSFLLHECKLIHLGFNELTQFHRSHQQAAVASRVIPYSSGETQRAFGSPMPNEDV